MFVLAKIDSWTDGIPLYGTILLFTSEQKAKDWPADEYGDDWEEEFLVNDEEVADAMNDCTYGPEGWQIWEQDIH